MDGSEIIIKQEQAPTPTSDTGNKLSWWIFERVKPFVVGRVLEITDGKGNIASVCEERGIRLEALSINLEDETFDSSYIDLLGVFDTVIAFNKSNQSIANRGVIKNCGKLLKKDGYLFIQLPAHTALYNGLDQGLERWKSYNWQYINAIVNADYEIVKVRYFIVGDNLLPIFQQLSKYMKKDAIFSMNDAITFNQAGLSILIVCKKNR